MGVGETGQIIGETGVGETGVGEMGVTLWNKGSYILGEVLSFWRFTSKLF